MGPIDFFGAFIGLAVIGALLGSLVSIPVGLVVDAHADDYWQQQAVEAGHAEFYRDDVEGPLQWRWLPVDKEQPHE